MIDFLVALYVFVISLFVGSFINVVAYRLPRKMSLANPPSSCPKCGKRITWKENIPVLSWLLLQGRCSGCGESISPVYPIVELSMGVLGLMAFLVLGFSFTFAIMFLFGAVLLSLGMVEYYKKKEDHNS